MRFKSKQPGSSALPLGALPRHLSDNDFLSLVLYECLFHRMKHGSDTNKRYLQRQEGENRRELRLRI